MNKELIKTVLQTARFVRENDLHLCPKARSDFARGLTVSAWAGKDTLSEQDRKFWEGYAATDHLSHRLGAQYEEVKPGTRQSVEMIQEVGNCLRLVRIDGREKFQTKFAFFWWRDYGDIF